MNESLIELNKKIELEMVQTAKDKLKNMMESNDEHSLQFSMFIKKTFGIVYEFIKENPPPFEIYLQQSAYTIAAALVNTIFSEVPLRDLVRDKDRGLKLQLGWDVKLPYEYIREQQTTVYQELNKCHTRMMNLTTTIIDEYEQFSHFKDFRLYCFQGVIDAPLKREFDDFMYVLNQNLDDEYLKSIEEYMREYHRHVAFCVENYVGQADNALLRRSLNKLMSPHSLEEIIMTLCKETEFLTINEHTIEAFNDGWMIEYISQIIEQLDCIECVNGSDYGITPAVVVGTDEVREELYDYIGKASILRPTSLPIVRKPLEWEIGLTEGGFHHIDSPLVPSRLPHHILPAKTYLNALNKIQSSGFRINKRVLQFAKTIGVLVAGKKKRPKDWTAERYTRHKKSVDSKNRDMKRIMDIAEEYAEFESIWFTMYCDFRYRMYYRQEYLSPQGQDLSKALLEFDVGMPVNAKALKWMKINIANLGGYDDVSYRKRVDWVRRNQEKIIGLVENPKDPKNQAWMMKADKPWQFLAACIDFVEYLENPKTHLSHLPVGMDGKCNGTQHWCAMLRDRVGGSKVALTDSEVPSDLYSEVLAKLLNKLDVVVKTVLPDDDESEEMERKRNKRTWAINWTESDGMKRKLVKTPTMTTTYSAGKKAFRGYVANFCIDNGLVFSDDEKIQRQHVNYMVDEIILAIDATVSAKAGMRFVQDCVAGQDEAHWESPIGAHVYMSPKRTFKREFKVRVDGRIRRITFSYEGDKTDHLAIHTGVSPNFIHMMDATHMAMTVNYCPQITHWMMIHDQFSCHAYFVEDMQKGIRVTFVDLYKVDRLEDFRNQQGLTEEDVPLPKYGDLDINEVLKSKYFFS